MSYTTVQKVLVRFDKRMVASTFFVRQRKIVVMCSVLFSTNAFLSVVENSISLGNTSNCTFCVLNYTILQITADKSKVIDPFQRL